MGRPTDSSSGSKRKAPYEAKDGVKKAKTDYQKSSFTKRRNDGDNEDGGAKLIGYKGDKSSKPANGFQKPSESG